MSRRVAITGIGIVSPIGHDLRAAVDALTHDRHGISHQSQWDVHDEMLTRLAAPVTGLDLNRWPRKASRSMGRVARLATVATESALADAGLSEEQVRDPRTGLAYGSTHGSTLEWEKFALTLESPNALLGLGSNAYLKFSAHTCAANLAVFLGIRGRVITTCAACVSASQAIGYGYEAIRYGMQDRMICGGAEELHYISTGVFDVLQATSTKHNDDPDSTPRPFDADRDGLVVGEGAGTLVLEAWDTATKRGAHIHGEVVGFGTSCDGTHITAPSPQGMESAIRLALQDAQLSADALDYVNAHATATAVGDRGESLATLRAIGEDVPISSTKAFTGHTLGACGAIEAAFCLAMMAEGFLAPSRNLAKPDPQCAPLAYVMGDPRPSKPTCVMTNNFAFGGINTSLILRRP